MTSLSQANYFLVYWITQLIFSGLMTTDLGKYFCLSKSFVTFFLEATIDYHPLHQNRFILFLMCWKFTTHVRWHWIIFIWLKEQSLFSCCIQLCQDPRFLIWNIWVQNDKFWTHRKCKQPKNHPPFAWPELDLYSSSHVCYMYCYQSASIRLALTWFVQF